MLDGWYKPGGTTLECKGWLQEAALRMLLNNLDPEVAEDPENLIVYGGTGRAARSPEAFRKILSILRKLEDDETLLVQSGKPVGVARTHRDAPRILIANSNLVPAWANWEHFRDLEDRGLMMYGQMTAGSWIYIGTQGILQGTYETLVEAGRKHWGTDLTGRLVLTGGLGGMGGAQPLAVTMANGVCLAVDVDEGRIRKRMDTAYLDKWTADLDEALAWAQDAQDARRPLSVGILGNAATVLPDLLARGLKPDMVTDQTSAHDALGGYVPHQVSYEEALALRSADPDRYVELSKQSMAAHVRAMLAFQRGGAHVFDYGNNIRQQALDVGVEDAFDFPGFVPAYIRPLFCEGKGPFRWCALSGDPADIHRTDDVIRELFPEDKALMQWIDKAQEQVKFQGLPCRICWLGYGDRAKAGLAFNELVRTGQVKAPIVIGRDHLDCGSVASPNRETEGMKDGTDAVADWPLLNLMLNTTNGASWVSFHHGGGVGIGYSLHAGMVIVADGTDAAADRLQRVLTGDPLMGVLRHHDAGYEEATACAKRTGAGIPEAY